MEDKKLSQVISHALRHKPEDYNLKLSKDGWVSVDELAKGIKNKVAGYSNLNSHDIINLVIGANNKRHQIINGRIRALHGHSLKMENVYEPLVPPDKLFHATASKYWDIIKVEGLKQMGRKYVHLSVHKQGATEVAIKKYKKIILLQIDAIKASENSILFYSNDRNSIWMCELVPPQYISIAVER